MFEPWNGSAVPLEDRIEWATEGVDRCRHPGNYMIPPDSYSVSYTLSGDSIVITIKSGDFIESFDCRIRGQFVHKEE